MEGLLNSMQTEIWMVLETVFRNEDLVVSAIQTQGALQCASVSCKNWPLNPSTTRKEKRLAGPKPVYGTVNFVLLGVYEEAFDFLYERQEHQDDTIPFQLSETEFDDFMKRIRQDGITPSQAYSRLYRLTERLFLNRMLQNPTKVLQTLFSYALEHLAEPPILHITISGKEHFAIRDLFSTVDAWERFRAEFLVPEKLRAGILYVAPWLKVFDLLFGHWRVANHRFHLPSDREVVRALLMVNKSRRWGCGKQLCRNLMTNHILPLVMHANAHHRQEQIDKLDYIPNHPQPEAPAERTPPAKRLRLEQNSDSEQAHTHEGTELHGVLFREVIAGAPMLDAAQIEARVEEMMHTDEPTESATVPMDLSDDTNDPIAELDEWPSHSLSTLFGHGSFPPYK